MRLCTPPKCPSCSMWTACTSCWAVPQRLQVGAVHTYCMGSPCVCHRLGGSAKDGPGPNPSEYGSINGMCQAL